MPRARRREAFDPTLEFLLTLDQVCKLLNVPLDQIDSQVQYRDLAGFRYTKGDKVKMIAFRILYIDDKPTWRIPYSSYRLYCEKLGILPRLEAIPSIYDNLNNQDT